MNRHLPLLHHYLAVRRKRLGLDELHMYDLYTPIVKKADRKVPYREAVRTVEAALEPLGEAYLGGLREGLAGRWIDVHENEGKTSGAYSWGAYGSHPFVLLNYQETVHDMFVVAHTVWPHPSQIAWPPEGGEEAAQGFPLTALQSSASSPEIVLEFR